MTATLRLLNTLTRKIEPFESLEEGRVRIYTCGPTIYDYSHIGNFRTFLFEDVLRRTLRLFGYQVTQVMNLTDVDDKTIRGAQEAALPLREFTEQFAEAFFEDLETLGAERAEHYPRATDWVPQMVELIQRLEERGHCYRSDGSIYYRISSFPDYGKLSGVRPEQNIAGARVDSDEYDKEDARDFVLWKAAKEGDVSWDTAVGTGRPGWSLECSAMAMALLGESFDIHCGGVDNIFPHHENEIAQSEGATGKPFAGYWLHAEHLVVEGQKMAKSLGNFFTLRDLIARGHDPLVIRYLLISVPYRQKLNFTEDGLHASAQAVERIANTMRRLGNAPPAHGDGDLDISTVEKSGIGFREALADDLNTAKALAELHTLVRQVNTALDGQGISVAVREALGVVLDEINSVLGVFPPDKGAAEGDERIQKLVDERTAARAAKDFGLADEIRDQLADMDVVIEDTPHGTVWHKR